MFDEPVETTDGASEAADSAPEARLASVPSVYLDTSVPSYLTARPARQPIALRKQRVSCLWWNVYRGHFNIYVSSHVLQEASRGNTEAAQRRIDMLSRLESLDVTDEAEDLAISILRETGLPERAKPDAQHVSVAATHGVQLLLTWNCRHLANPEMIPKVWRACHSAGLKGPEICTPDHAIRRHVYGKRSDH
jgi:predicted nucleic acid-binding protein